jgi:hypothetical protein
MKKDKPTIERVYRERTPEERAKVDVARAKTEAQKDAILAEGHAKKAAGDRMREEVQQTIQALHQRREELGLIRIIHQPLGDSLRFA